MALIKENPSLSLPEPTQQPAQPPQPTITLEKLIVIVGNELSKANIPIRLSNQGDRENQVVYGHLLPSTITTHEKAQRIKDFLKKQPWVYGSSPDDDQFWDEEFDKLDFTINTHLIRGVHLVVKNQSQSTNNKLGISLISHNGKYSLRLNSTKGYAETPAWFAFRLNEYETNVSFKPFMRQITQPTNKPAQSQALSPVDDLF